MAHNSAHVFNTGFKYRMDDMEYEVYQQDGVMFIYLEEGGTMEVTNDDLSTVYYSEHSEEDTDIQLEWRCMLCKVLPSVEEAICMTIRFVFIGSFLISYDQLKSSDLKMPPDWQG